jgi:O-antigen/teichoic acid export membrane protein
MVGFILGECMAFGLTVWFTKQHQQVHGATNTKLWDYAKQAIAYGWRVQIVLFYTLLLYRGVIFIIDSQLSSAEVGVFAVALTIVEKSAVLSQAVAVASFSQMKGAGEMSAASLDRLALIALGATLGAGLVLAWAAEIFIVRLLGAGYALVPKLVLLLVPGVAAFGAGRLYLNYILVNDRMDGLLIHAFMILLASLFLALLLLTQYHLAGVAMATSLAFIVFTIYLKQKEKFK